MLKLGIYKEQQLKPDYLENFWNRRKFLALDLYHCLDDLPKDERDKIQERMLIRFSVANGTFKYTYANRFEDFENRAVSFISDHYSGQDVTVHDIGVSDGRTTHGFYKKLNNVFGEALSYLASDYAPYLYIVKRPGSARRVIVDEDGAPLQIVFPPFVFNLVLPEHRLFYPVNHVVRWLVNFFYARPLLRDRAGEKGNVEEQRFELVCKECRDYIRSADNFSFRQYDMFSPANDVFDVIRVMNVLNERYFSEAQLKMAVESIDRSLKFGGFFITGSNMEQGTVIDGGIYQKTLDGYKRLYQSGEGSLVDRFIIG
ncbi:MAG: hypothetical protein H6868_08630 [Rhodospirillales bacterium]|nr:hypothetical protein [Rhodospirillales bacterium]